MLVRLAVAVIVLAGLAPATLPVDLEFQPRPYVVATSDGAYFFKMSPDPEEPDNRDKGFGYAFKPEVGRDNTQLWSTSGWYADQVFLARDGKHLVRLGNWPRGSEPSKSDLALGFYESGQLLKSYSTAELIRDPSRVIRTASHYGYLGDVAPGFASEPTLLADTLAFRLVTCDGIEYLFDAVTGNISSSRQL
jgi:hypothetical protein